jgi:hypothetical protein
MDGGPGQNRVSSPISTGGEGVFFEQHVAAYWLAQLLVRSIPPILTDTGVTEVHFQSEHLGFNTDDFLVVCARAGAANARLVGQVKRSFTISAADDECKKAIGDFWKDFKKADPFNPQHDRFVLVTLRGTNTLLENLVGLLDCARGAADGEEFQRRLSLDGFISTKSVHQCNELCHIVSALEGTPVIAKDLWPFLRLLHVLSLDLHTSTRQTEAHIKTLLALKSTEPDPVASATSAWDALLAFASEAGPAARSLKRADLPAGLVQACGEVGANEQRVLTALKNHTEFVLRKIRTTIGPAFHLRRAGIVQKVLAAVEAKQVVLITGPAGSGKSVIGKEAVAFLSRKFFAFGFRVEEFAVAHIDETLHNSQIPARATELQAILGAQGRKVLVIESVERLLEKPTRDAFSDLMTLAQGDDGLGILMTCRDYSVEQVQASFLQAAGIDYAVIEVPPLDDTELQEIQAAFPSLAVPLANPALREILRNPYFIDKALQIPWDAGRPLPENERDFRAVFWRQIVRADQNPADGMPRQREVALQELAVRRARALSDYVPATGLSAAAIALLKQDSLVVSPDANALLVATAHDVLEDWAILQWIEEQHLTDETAFKALSSAIGPHPAVRRSYRKWVAELVDRDAPAADRLFSAAIAQADVPAHRMDFRQYDVAHDQPVAGETSAADGEGPAKNYIRLEPKPPAPEVQQLIDESTKKMGEMNARLGVYMWGLQIFQREDGSADPAQWREKLASAKGMDRTAEHPDNSRNAPGFVAAVCVRDHWDEMSPEEKEWCIDVICSEISRHADQWGTIDRVQRFSMLADRPCAFVVPLLLSKPLTEAQTPRVRQASIAALTHPIDEVRWYATWGMNDKLWAANPALALRAVNAIATEAALADRGWNAEEKKRYDKRRTPDTIAAAAAADVRGRFWTEGEIAEDAHVRFDITEVFGAEAHAKVLAILGQVPNDPLAVAAHRRASEDLVECWNREHDRSPDRRDRNFHKEQAISDRIQQFVMRASDADAEQVLQPILEAVDRHPREVHNVIQGFTSSEDSNPNTPHYWFLWNLFAERVKRAKWLAHLDREHPHGSEVLSTIFLTAWWKDNVRHWRSLEGYAHNVDALFDALPPVWIVLDSYVRFLYHIGERSMPAAFVRIANALRRGNPAEMLRESNTVFMLEVLLQRHVYARPLELKRDPALREAILYVLDVLVESGSSAAFRMRDDFVTPAA